MVTHNDPAHHASADDNAAIVTRGNSYPLPGYSRVSTPQADVVAQTSLLGAFLEIVRANGTLYGWAREQVQPQALSGRAPVYVATLPVGAAATVVVRHSWHGGLLAPITGDLYLRPTRAPLELLRSFMLRECEIPTPELLAFALYPAGPLMVRVDVATRYVPNAHDLAGVLAGFAAEVSRAEALAAVQTLLVQLASRGFHHPDLNVKNILLARERGQCVAYVLDVDVLQWNTKRAASEIMLANTARLARSLRKARRQFGIAFSDAELNDLVASLLAATPLPGKA